MLAVVPQQVRTCTSGEGGHRLHVLALIECSASTIEMNEEQEGRWEVTDIKPYHLRL